MIGFRWIALGIVFALLAFATMTFAFWLSSILAATALGCFVKYGFDAIKAGGRHSLQALQRVHEREETRKLLEEEPSISDEAEVVCPSCFEPYHRRLRVCPRCGRVP